MLKPSKPGRQISWVARTGPVRRWPVGPWIDGGIHGSINCQEPVCVISKYTSGLASINVTTWWLTFFSDVCVHYFSDNKWDKPMKLFFLVMAYQINLLLFVDLLRWGGFDVPLQCWYHQSSLGPSGCCCLRQCCRPTLEMDWLGDAMMCVKLGHRCPTCWQKRDFL